MKLLRRTVISLSEPLGEIIVHDLGADWLKRRITRPFRKIEEELRLHGGVREATLTCDLPRLFDPGLVNCYDISESGNPLIQRVGYAVPVRLPNVEGQFLRRVDAPAPLTDIMAHQIEAVAQTGRPALHHIYTSYNGYAHHRLILPVIDRNGKMVRVAAFCLWPSDMPDL
jgi:hypothetical protein